MAGRVLRQTIATLCKLHSYWYIHIRGKKQQAVNLLVTHVCDVCEA
jgi:hypothetical protein